MLFWERYSILNQVPLIDYDGFYASGYTIEIVKYLMGGDQKAAVKTGDMATLSFNCNIFILSESDKIAYRNLQSIQLDNLGMIPSDINFISNYEAFTPGYLANNLGVPASYLADKMLMYKLVYVDGMFGVKWCARNSPTLNDTYIFKGDYRICGFKRAGIWNDWHPEE